MKNICCKKCLGTVEDSPREDGSGKIRFGVCIDGACSWCHAAYCQPDSPEKTNCCNSGYGPHFKDCPAGKYGTDSTEEKCCEECKIVGTTAPSDSYLVGQCADSDCPCHKPETTHEKGICKCSCHSGASLPGKGCCPHNPKISHEKDNDNDCGVGISSTQNKTENVDFIEEALREYWDKFGYIDNYPNGMIPTNDVLFTRKVIAKFLKEKLHEAKVLGAEMYYLMGEENGIKAGRLAMKEEIEIKAKQYTEDPADCYNIRVIPFNKFLAAIREMK